MNQLSLRLYAAFAAVPSGGNIAGVVYDDIGLTPAEMQDIACVLGAPTTGYVRQRDDDSFDVRFFSSRCEMDMCGHVTVGIFASLHDDQRIHARAQPYIQVTAAGEVPVTVERRAEGAQVTMRQRQPRFGLAAATAAEIAGPLGIDAAEILTVEASSTGLSHIFVQLPDEPSLARLRPDDEALRAFSRAKNIDTIGVWCLQQSKPGSARVRLRDLCHGVGDPEEAASGTTNGALACLLMERGGVEPSGAGQVIVESEQGFEMGRASRITTRLQCRGSTITDVDVGGSALRRMSGEFLLQR